MSGKERWKEREEVVAACSAERTRATIVGCKCYSGSAVSQRE